MALIKGKRGWRRDATAGDESRGGAAQGSPEFTKSSAPGVASTRAWVGCVQRVTRDELGPKTGYGGALLAGHGCRGGSARRSSPARCVRAVPVLGCGRKGVREALRSKRKTTRAYAGLCGAAEAWPWRSGGGGSPAAVLRQPSGPRPKFLGEKGGTGLQGAHQGVAVDGVAAQGSRRRSPGGGRGRRSRRRSLQRLAWSAAGLGELPASRRSRCAAWPGSGAAERRKHGGAEERRGVELVEAAARVYGGAWDGWDTGVRWAV